MILIKKFSSRHFQFYLSYSIFLFLFTNLLFKVILIKKFGHFYSDCCDFFVRNDFSRFMTVFTVFKVNYEVMISCDSILDFGWSCSMISLVNSPSSQLDFRLNVPNSYSNRSIFL